MSDRYCDLCDEFSGGTRNTFSRIYAHDSKRRILLRSEEFVVIPSLGQIVEGYLLVVPTTHRTALGDIPDESLEELRRLCGRVRAVLECEYGSCIFFEHGTRLADVGGCGVYHAHLHAFPFPSFLGDPVNSLRSKFPYRELGDLSEIKRQTEGLAAYLFYQNSHAESYVFETGVLPSQYVRKLLAEALNKDDWDWRTVGREEQLLATISRLSNYFGIIPTSLGPKELSSDTHR
ncbi:MAG: hypothetical protein DMG28_09070 [Acidobacteria bacterium]|nr:MAG: hypothetical protein DMG28_09070 [Acidobacteriota bacterium]